ncbi:hypothetical protein GGS20DRAFT_559605 [Poronia punctata]|nr:hypothetical protein GGS20DRAFT_559605 [Poronia punctata]
MFDHDLDVGEGEKFKITENLSDALRQLSSFVAEEQDLLLWVDAVCINQQDVRERGKPSRAHGQDIPIGRDGRRLAWQGGGGRGE